VGCPPNFPPQLLLFLWLKTPGRERETEKNDAVNSGHLVLWECTQPLGPRFDGISSWARLTGKIHPVGVEIWEVALIISFDNIWFGLPSLIFKFGKDPTSGYSDIPNNFFWGRLLWKVVLIVSFHNIWLGLLSFSFKFGKDPTSGCWDIPIFQSSWPVWVGWGRLAW
jgi:hypothetical protein